MLIDYNTCNQNNNNSNDYQNKNKNHETLMVHQSWGTEIKLLFLENFG